MIPRWSLEIKIYGPFYKNNIYIYRFIDDLKENKVRISRMYLNDP